MRLARISFGAGADQPALAPAAFGTAVCCGESYIDSSRHCPRFFLPSPQIRTTSSREPAAERVQLLFASAAE